MDFNKACEIVSNHPELRKQMAEMFETSQDVINISDVEFEVFYCDFVSLAVENNPTLLD